MAEIVEKKTCGYCGEKHSVSVITKQTKYSRSLKVKKCEKCGRQNGLKQIMMANETKTLTNE